MLKALSLGDEWLAVPAVVRAGTLMRSRDGDALKPHWLVRLEHILSVARQNMSVAGHGDRFADVAFDVADNTAANALAFQEGKNGLVLVFSGLFKALGSHIERALATTDFLSEYAPALNDRACSSLEVLSQCDIEQLDARSSWALSFFSRTIDFVVHHELAHLARGHHALLARSSEAMALDEAMAAGENVALISDRQLMELDADANALDMILVEGNAERAFAEWPESFIEDEFFNTMLSVLMVCQVLDHAHRPVNAPGARSHPAPVIRAIQFGKVLSYTFEHLFPSMTERLIDIHDQAWWEASQVALACGLPEGRWHGEDMREVPEELVAAIDAGLSDFASRLENQAALKHEMLLNQAKRMTYP
jgi:hypothetical protein